MSRIIMNYWNNKKNVEVYIKMAKGYDGRDLIEILKKHLPPSSSVLEIGMGPGKDLDILKEIYNATGTDISGIFVDQYKEKHTNSDVFVLDAINLETDRTFDCIYSNKTLQHLTKPEFHKSLKKQKELLNPNGILFHSLWKGNTEEKYGELLFVYYTEEILLNIVKGDYQIIEMGEYTEAEENDSLYIILKKRV
jgi:SAM-dependent methyltransferase